jgi:hypothetical protein
MTTFQPKKLAATLAAAAIAIVLAAPAMAQPTPHSHEAAAPHKLALDHGRTWKTDAPLRDGMGRIRDLVAPRLGESRAGRLDAAEYGRLAAQVQTEVGTIVAQCKLDPKADAMLHLVIADLLEGTDAMAGKTATLRPAQGLSKVAVAVNEYGAHFDHPGFKPLRTGS